MEMYNDFKIDELVKERRFKTTLLLQSKRKQIRFNKWIDQK